jgi:anti-anti-sigma factor
MLLQVAKTESPRGFRLVGEMDISNVGVLAEALEPEVQRGGDLTLDLAGLAFMDSSGIQAIIRTARRLEGRGRLTLLGPGDLVRKTLDRVRLWQLANVEITDEEKPETR